MVILARNADFAVQKVCGGWSQMGTDLGDYAQVGLIEKSIDGWSKSAAE